MSNNTPNPETINVVSNTKLEFVDPKNKKPIAVINPRLDNVEVLRSFGTAKVESTLTGGMKHAGFSILEIGLSSSSLRLSRDAALYCAFGAPADYAHAHDTGLQKNVIKRIKQETKQFKQATKSRNSTFLGACAGMQHILKFCFGVEMQEYIPTTGETYKGKVGKVDHFTPGKINQHDVKVIEQDSLIGKALKKINNTTGVTKVLSSNKQGFDAKDIEKVNEDIKKEFGDKTAFKLLVTAIAEDNIAECVEVRDLITNKTIAYLTQFHPEYHQESKFFRVKSKNVIKNKEQADIFSASYLKTLNEEIVDNMKQDKDIFSKEASEQIIKYIDIVQSRGKGLSSVKINDIEHDNILDIFKKEDSQTVITH